MGKITDQPVLATRKGDAIVTVVDVDDGLNKQQEVDVLFTGFATEDYVDTAVSGASIADGDKGDIVVSGTGSVWALDASINFTGKTLLNGDWDNANITNSVLDDCILTTTSTVYVADSTFRVRDEGDLTKILQFQASGIPTATTVTLAAPETSGTIALKSDILSFKTIAISGQSDIVADSAADTLTLVAGTGITITTNAGSDSITINASASGATELKGLTFTSDTGSTADSDPGNGLFKWNNATEASSTFLYFDNQTLDAISMTTYFAALGSAGFIYLQQSDDSTKWQLWKWTAVTAGAGYCKFAVTLMANGGTIAHDKTVYCTFDSDATGSSSGRHMVSVKAGAMFPSPTSGCASLSTFTGASGQPSDQVLLFDFTTQEYAEFSIEMPESWDEGTVTFMPVWSHSAAVTNFGTVWDLQGVAISDDDTLAVNFGTAQTSTDTGGTTNDRYVGPESSAITIAGTPAAGDCVYFRLSRIPTNGSDTLQVDARLHGIRLYMTTNASTD